MHSFIEPHLYYLAVIDFDFLTIGFSDYWTFGLFGFQTIGLADYWAFRLLGFQTIGPSDYWNFELLDLMTIELSDYWDFELLDFQNIGLIPVLQTVILKQVARMAFSKVADHS